MTRKKKPQTKKAEPRKLKVKWEMPTTYSIQLDTLVLHPPPTSIEKCPRCGKKHKSIKPKKLGKPMEFYAYDPPPSDPKTPKVAPRPEAKPTPRLVSRASYWAVCPKTKEPIVLFDRVDRGSTIENIVVKQAVDDIVREEDKRFLDSLKGFASKTGKRGKGKKNDAPVASTITATFGPTQTWVASWGPAEVSLASGPPPKKGKKQKTPLVYDPNAPERIVPGTEKVRAEQAARVRAQEKAAKKLRKR